MVVKVVEVVEVVEEDKPGFFRGFLGFVREQGVIGLAVGLAIGTSAGASVKVIVDQFISPIVGFLIGGVDLSALKWTIVGVNEQGKGQSYRQGHRRWLSLLAQVSM